MQNFSLNQKCASDLRLVLLGKTAVGETGAGGFLENYFNHSVKKGDT